MKHTMHYEFLTRALILAQQGQGFCAPNPAVGAVLVRNQEIISEGWHHGPGLAHAEVEAIQSVAEETLRECDLYVTLEPCCHYGRTPPCTDLIIQKKIRHVYFGYADPNPIVSGNGQRRLQAVDIPCDRIAHSDIENFYRPYQFWWHHRKPWVTIKLAITESHAVALSPMTGIGCQRVTHEARLHHDALLTTVETILQDDPQLNARLLTASVKKPLYILDSSARLPLDAQVLKTCAPITLFYNQASKPPRLAALEALGIACVSVPTRQSGLDLDACLEHIGADGKHTLWVEAGLTCFKSFVCSGLVQHIILYVASSAASGVTRGFDFFYELGQFREIEFSSAENDVIVNLS